jgi:hypothetical protein
MEPWKTVMVNTFTNINNTNNDLNSLITKKTRTTQFTVKEQDAPGDLSRTHSKFYFNLNKFSVFKF